MQLIIAELVFKLIYAWIRSVHFHTQPAVPLPISIWFYFIPSGPPSPDSQSPWKDKL